MGSKTFRVLQAKWYHKLEEVGFEDIERTENRSDFTSYFQSEYTPTEFEAKKDYFHKAKELLHRDIFIDGVERRIWALHTMGYPIRRIVDVLKSESVERNKNEVNACINEFQRMIRER